MKNEPMSGVLERNIQTLVEHSRKRQAERTPELRIADGITRFCGSIRPIRPISHRRRNRWIDRTPSDRACPGRPRIPSF